MLVMHVRHVPSTVKNPELDMIVDVAVIDVRRVVGEERLGRLCQCRVASCRRKRVARISDLRKVALSKAAVGVQGACRSGVSRSVHQHRRIADRPGAQKKLFKLAIDAIAHWTHADPVGINFCADSARAIVDGESISAGLTALLCHIWSR